MSKTKSLLTILGSVVLLGAALVSSLRKEEEIVKKPEKPKTAESVYTKTEKVDLFLQDGEKREEEIKVDLNVDNVNNKVLFEVETQNFDKKEWKQEAMQSNKFTRINEGWTRVYLIHPQEVSVSSEEQVGYAVPLHQWIKLIPVEECEACQVEQKEGKKIITELTGLVVPIPKADEYVGDFIDSERKKKDPSQQALEDLAREGTIVTKIPGDVQQNMSSTLTARTYTIKIDTSQVPDGQTIPIQLWTRMALGDPSIAPDGMSPNRYGLHEKMFSFTMVGKKGISNDEIEVYTKEVEGQTDLFIETNREEKRLTKDKNIERYPVLSPNKKRIAFSRKENGINWIYVMNLDGSKLKKIDHTGHTAREPKWSADSKGVIFMKERSMVEHNGWEKINVYTYFQYNPETRQRKIIGGNDWDLDTRQVIPYNETSEERTIRRREWIENERKHGRKVRITE